MATKKKRPCKYCGKDLRGTKLRTVCLSKKCRKKHDKASAIKRNERSAQHTLKVKIERLKKNPIYCANCGDALTEFDNLRRPVCKKDACQVWWLDERKRRVKRSVAISNANRDRSTKGKTFIPRIGEWNHRKYLKEQTAFNKPNGRGLCQICKKVVLTGNQMQRCKPC